jgi:membrane protein implicated in regulation of membrane protease activity
MNAESTPPSRNEVIDEVSKWGVGAGIVTVALAPLAIPIIVLTLVALLPLALPVVALGILALPVLLVRALWRHRPRRSRRSATEEEVLVGVELTPAHHPLVK